MKKYVCESCSKPISDKDKFCSHCGSQFDLENSVIVDLETEIKRLLKKNGVDTGVTFNVEGNLLECWFTEPKPGFTKEFLRVQFPTSVKKQSKGNFVLNLKYFDSENIQDAIGVAIDPNTDNLEIKKGTGTLLLARAQLQYLDMIRSSGDTKSKVFGGVQFKVKPDFSVVFEKDGEVIFTLTKDEADKVSTQFMRNENKISKTSVEGEILVIPNSFRKNVE